MEDYSVEIYKHYNICLYCDRLGETDWVWMKCGKLWYKRTPISCNTGNTVAVWQLKRHMVWPSAGHQCFNQAQGQICGVTVWDSKDKYSFNSVTHLSKIKFHMNIKCKVCILWRKKIQTYITNVLPHNIACAHTYVRTLADTHRHTHTSYQSDRNTIL